MTFTRFGQPGGFESAMQVAHPVHRRSTKVNRAAVILASVLLAGCGSSAKSARPGSGAQKETTTSVQLLSVSEPSWQLQAPLSRMVLLPAGSGKLAILGGLTAADTSASGVFELNLSDGSLKAVGRLPSPVHDAAGAVIGGNYLVMGGGSTSTVSTVEAFSTDAAGSRVIGKLPQPRSDCGALTVGSRVIVVGGYNGSSADPSVLSTSDGVNYKSVATLELPVRYPALAVSGSKIYVFGGMAVSGARAGLPVAQIQVIDLSKGTSSVIGSLPQPLEGAEAFNLNGHIFIGGGDSAQPGSTGSNPNLSSNSTVWQFVPGSKLQPVATLALGVSNAGVAVTGGNAWLVGGEHNGKTTSVVQNLSVASSS